MCLIKSPSAKATPTPAPAVVSAPAPAPVVVAPAAAAAPTTPGGTADELASRKDAAVLKANRGRSALRIDRTAPSTGSSGSGLNIPV